ncbi:metallophosphoesterase family protein [Bacillus carboniphilus]|uniref:Metallophosphoesterase family protein n=1 Tax=Bacillus carboniphilus TaxID=86663 RepID=A0ABY9JRM6_9BACI|nr:metallophosphoesterase family protein [Bacillus carboniphilus]WLR42041.1 metallophosphoesterase family protein [Bacillus carboniphilus]
MKVAALYDIHGNLPALNAVLEELKEVQPDLILIGGDIVSGPMPVETLERIFQLDEKVRYIRGNGDREVVMAYDGQSLQHMSEKGRENQEWVAEQITPLQRDFLAQLPEQEPFHIEGFGEILFCHATPNSDEEIFTPNTTMKRLSTIFQNVSQKYVVCGHTHIQFEHEVDGLSILNAGSVGMPFADQPGAYWLLLTPDGYEFRRTTYSKEEAAKVISTSKDPQAQEFIETYVVKGVPEAKGMEILEGLANKQYL